MINFSPKNTVSARTAATYLRWLGIAGFWSQLGGSILGAGLLLLAMISRRLSEDTTSSVTGAALFFAVSATVALIIGTLLSRRYRGLAEQIEQPSFPTPNRVDTIQRLEAGLLTGALGITFALIGTETGALSLLSRAMIQPQSVAVYDPEKVIRVLDTMAIAINGGLAIVHALSVSATVWLIKLIAKEV